tara:strand:+ start:365 stop:1321 length:957 start_codon:yes stop_codon:yes gene_type:complete
MQFFQLIGTQRSGSNLFRLMLNEFEEIYAPHPPHLLSTFHKLQNKYNDFDQLISDMIKWVKFNPIKWNDIPSKQKIKDLIREENVFEIFKAIYTSSNPKFWCCKSLQNFNFFNNKNFKGLNPIYIYIYRDGRDVASSFKKASIGEKHIYNIAKKWNEDQKKCFEIEKKTDDFNFFSVKYEDLLSNPTLIINNFCAKYGLSYNDKFINYYKSSESKKASISGGLWKNLSKPLIRDNKNKYQKELTAKEILIFESINKLELSRLDYKINNSDSNLNFSFNSDDINKFDIINSELKIKAYKNLSSYEKKLIHEQKRIISSN